ncbi:hypothetical protein FSARC_13654 [Fusarium sarcochroum]|uniref:Enoyl reductase (ER) domain-containing protein n=1 Tax=Fusarium sarcochroum TaxID=1208366 RepID=A0A8H4SZP1_9HYPO|nr:hypothetical protein FSARC_13654 [Fusarium sarcochroum]
MEEAYVSPELQVEVHRAAIPSPKQNEVLIKVAFAGMNPKDWKVPIFAQQAMNSGDDLAGVVEAVGQGVFEFKPGDRVAAMHAIASPHGSFAEYAIAPTSTTFHIPLYTTFEEASTIPLAGLTAAYGLFDTLGLPAPWSASKPDNGPLVIHGAGTAIGAFAIKLANAAQIHPIIATAGNSIDFVRGLLRPDKGDVLIDYRQPRDKLVAEIQSAISAASQKPAWFGLDGATNQDGAPEYTGVLKDALGTQPGLEAFPSRKPRIATVQGRSKVTGSVEGDYINVMLAHTGSDYQKCFAHQVSRLFAYGLAQGWLTGHPTEVLEGGLAEIGPGLERLKNGQVHGKKLVVKVADD